MEIEGMTLEQVKYNIYAFGAQAKRFARFEAVEHPRAADLPTECPHGHGDLIIDHDHVYCDFCKFSASR